MQCSNTRTINGQGGTTMTRTRVLLTGAAGFVGSHVLRALLTQTDWDIVAPVTWRHHGNPDRITSATDGVPDWPARLTIDRVDLAAPIPATAIDRWGQIDYVLNVASESHVDRSITDPVPFIANNTALMVNVLEYARTVRPQAVLHMSTDEVYGPAPAGHAHAEWETIAPSNPYSASKAAQEAVAFSYWRTYGVPVVITNTMNIIGEMQDREKMVPKTLRSLLRREPVTVHTAPDGTPGSRFYLHARNLADAWLWLIANTEPSAYSDGATRPDRWNIVGEREIDNVSLVYLIADAAGIPADDVCIRRVDFHSSRPGHDLRYALDGSRLAAAGWKPPVPLDESVARTVQWTMAHSEWLV